MFWSHAELMARAASWRRQALNYRREHRDQLYRAARQAIFEARACRLHNLDKGRLP